MKYVLQNSEKLFYAGKRKNPVKDINKAKIFSHKGIANNVKNYWNLHDYTPYPLKLQLENDISYMIYIEIDSNDADYIGQKTELKNITPEKFNVVTSILEDLEHVRDLDRIIAMKKEGLETVKSWVEEGEESDDWGDIETPYDIIYNSLNKYSLEDLEFVERNIRFPSSDYGYGDLITAVDYTKIYN